MERIVIFSYVLLNWTDRQWDRLVIMARGTGGNGRQDRQEGRGERRTGLREGQGGRNALMFPELASHSATVFTKVTNNQ